MTSEDAKKTEEHPIAVDLLQEDEMLGELPPTGCGILGRYPVVSVLLFALVGIGMGIGLSRWNPEDSDKKDITLKWLGLIGDMFIRGLKATVLPMVFINVTISVVEMMSLGRASKIGWLTIGLYLLTTVLAAIIGVISIVSFQGLFNEGNFETPSPPQITLGCNDEGMFVTELEDGSLQCVEGSADSTNVQFFITDITGSFVRTSGSAQEISLSDTFYDGIFTKLITSNIFEAFVEANFAAVVIFAIAFGVALAKILLERVRGDITKSSVITLFKELDGVFFTIINWIIMITPFAVWSLIVKAIGNQDNLAEAFENVGYLVVATITANFFHFLIAYVGMLGLVRRENPFKYLSHIIPAQTMAFASASSAATIPMTLRCVKETGVVPDPIARFVVPLGATINMDGGAIYFPCACIWLAILNGITPNAASYVLLVIIATVGSAGTAPVPSASLVLIITAYNTVFNAEGIPNGFEFILAIDWFMDRLRTVLNVTGDSVVSGMVSHLSKYEDDLDVDKTEHKMEAAQDDLDVTPEEEQAEEELA